MVNEFRFGLRRSSNFVEDAFDSPDYSAAARNFFPTINGIPVKVSLPIVGSPMMQTGGLFTPGGLTQSNDAHLHFLRHPQLEPGQPSASAENFGRTAPRCWPDITYSVPLLTGGAGLVL
jgi:hypothetical protein